MNRPAFLTVVGTALLLAGCNKGGEGNKTPAAQTTSGATASAPGSLTLVIQDHKFTPAEITIPANQAVEVEIVNKDPLAEEFDSHDLHIEKVFAGNSSGTIRIKPQDPGRYSFMGEYHSATAQGTVIVK